MEFFQTFPIFFFFFFHHCIIILNSLNIKYEKKYWNKFIFSNAPKKGFPPLHMLNSVEKSIFAHFISFSRAHQQSVPPPLFEMRVTKSKVVGNVVLMKNLILYPNIFCCLWSGSFLITVKAVRLFSGTLGLTLSDTASITVSKDLVGEDSPDASKKKNELFWSPSPVRT